LSQLDLDRWVRLPVIAPANSDRVVPFVRVESGCCPRDPVVVSVAAAAG
jgi:hypothetical protein